MKKLLIICCITTGLVQTTNAQTITEQNGKLGLLFPSGKAALNYEYDNIVHAATGGLIQPIYYCLKKGKYGIYNMYDSTFTGCIYDSVYVHPCRTVITMRQKKLGFIAHDRRTLQWKTIEPAYDQIEWFGKEVALNYEYNEEENGILQVRVDTLWGLIGQNNGKIIAPIHFRFMLDHYSGGRFYESVDRKNERQILFDPRTGHEYTMTFLAEVKWMYEWNMLVTVDAFTGDSIRTVVWDLQTGAPLWRFSSYASDVKAVMYTPNIVMVTEEYSEVWNKEEKVVYTFYTINDHTTRLTYTGDNNSRIQTSNEDDRILVYASKTYNGKMKQIGEIVK